MVIDVHADTSKWTIADYGALGYRPGKIVGNRIPYFRGITPSADALKAIGAAMAATGAVALYHVEGVTPEAQKTGMIFPGSKQSRSSRQRFPGCLPIFR